MMKIIKTIFTPIIKLFKLIYTIIDKILITPISKLIYKVRDLLKNNNTKIEKILNMPNVLLYISLACAVLLFYLVDSEVISLTTSEAEILSDQPVKVVYNEESYIVEGVPESVDITLIGSKSALYLANQSSTNSVSLDLSGYGVGTYKVKLKYNSASSSIDYKLDPSSVTVKISSKVSEERTLTYDILNEKLLSEKLSISNVELSTSSVVIKSSQEILDKVAVVKALVDTKNLGATSAGDYDIEGVKLVAYDDDGNKVENVEIVPTSVTATVTLESHCKEGVPVHIETTGTMASGVAIESITSSVQTVDIYGSPSVVDSIEYVTATVNVNGINSDVSNKKVDITMPNGARYMTSTTTEITIKVGTETQITIPDVQVHPIENTISNGLVVHANTEEDQKIDVIVKGTQTVLDAITQELENNSDVSSYFSIQIDLSGKTASSSPQKIPVQVTINDPRIKVQPVKTTIEVNITKK